MDFIRGESRDQGTLFPEHLDDYIDEENPVRFIDVFVDDLELSALGFQRIAPAWTGRRPYDPRDLLKLYIYGYLNQIRSSRRLERETHRNVEVMWLLRRLRPDHKTIANFRKDNPKAFKGVFRAFTVVCRRLSLYGGELIAVDGSKFKAVNSPQRNFTKDKLKRRLQELDAKIERYLQELDDQDAQDAKASSSEADPSLSEKMQRLKERKVTYTHLLEDLEARGETQVSLTDPDSRAMPKSPKAKVGYNVQAATDDKHQLIVEEDVTNQANDKAQLSKISIGAKKVLDVKACRVVADGGYYNGETIKACVEKHIEPYVPKPDTSNSKSRGLYSKDDFIYDPQQDHYLCPAGQVLTYAYDATYRKKKADPGVVKKHYTTSACTTCGVRSLCTTNKNGRILTRWVHEHLLDEMAQRLEENPGVLHKRREMVEHPFGTLKFWYGYAHFLVKGLDKVKAEFSLMTLAYNIKRAINLVGVPKMVDAVG